MRVGVRKSIEIVAKITKQQKEARFAVCIARIPQNVTDEFISDGDVGKFRWSCRFHGVPEDIIDDQIRSLEKVADMIPDNLK